MGKYLVTGAAGFIGGAVAELLINRGDSVVTIDNLSTGMRERIPKGVDFIEGDAGSPKVIRKLNGIRFDAIIHLAGQSSGEVSFENPVYDLQTNTQSTLLLLDYACRNDIHRFVYAGSMSVYGDQNPPLVTEDSDTVPKSFYAVGKLASEKYMRIYASEFGITCTALRFFNIYGVGQNLSNLKQGMASIYLAMAVRDHKIIVKGSPDRFRDFVYIDDAVSSVMAALERKNGFDFYNVSTKHRTRVEEVIRIICDGLPYSVTTEYVSGTQGDQFGIYGDNSKIRKELGWSPQVKFEEGMARMTEWAVERMAAERGM